MYVDSEAHGIACRVLLSQEGLKAESCFFKWTGLLDPIPGHQTAFFLGATKKNNIKLPGLSNRSWLFWNTLSSAPVSSITIQPNMCSGTRFVAGGHSILIETRWFSIDRESNLSSMRLKLLGFQSLKGNRGFQSLKDHYINCIVFDISNTTTQCCRKLAVVYHSRQVPTISSRKKIVVWNWGAGFLLFALLKPFRIPGVVQWRTPCFWLASSTRPCERCWQRSLNQMFQAGRTSSSQPTPAKHQLKISGLQWTAGSTRTRSMINVG